MWYISFHGGSGGLNNIHAYSDKGEPCSNSKILPTGGSNPDLDELRGFAIVGDLLYVVNAHKSDSQVLIYRGSGDENYVFQEIFASNSSVNSILHPFDLTFDENGYCYVSSQDTNVVTGLRGTNDPLDIASYLQQQYPQGEFLAGTFVASSVGALPGVPWPAPPDVPTPQGLSVSMDSGSVSNSVRGVIFYDGYLYVADEPANTIKVYDGKTGELYGQIAGNLASPVHLLLDNQVLYIGSSDNASVLKYDLSGGAPSGTVAPDMFIDGEVKHVSGMAFGGDGNFYAAERKAQKIKKFPPDGSGSGDDFITDLSDDPEFIMYVPGDCD